MSPAVIGARMPASFETTADPDGFTLRIAQLAPAATDAAAAPAPAACAAANGTADRASAKHRPLFLRRGPPKRGTPAPAIGRRRTLPGGGARRAAAGSGLARFLHRRTLGRRFAVRARRRLARYQPADASGSATVTAALPLRGGIGLVAEATATRANGEDIAALDGTLQSISTYGRIGRAGLRLS